jgi:hypothetical protein
MRAVVVGCLLACACAPVLSTDAVPQDIAAIVESFRTSIIKKDKDKFLALFYPGASWVGVYGDGSLKQGQKQHPERGKAYSGSAASFMEMLRSSQQRFEEKFGTLSVNEDADIASVSFDYEFQKDGVTANHGKESWHLVRTAGGWKISSVVYSVNLVP